MFDIRDSADIKSVNCNKNVNSYSLVQTVEENESNCTSAEIKRDNESKTLERRMGGMPLRRFSSLLNNKQIRNANVMSQHAWRDEQIHGKETIRLRISSPRSKATFVKAGAHERSKRSNKLMSRRLFLHRNNELQSNAILAHDILRDKAKDV